MCVREARQGACIEPFWPAGAAARLLPRSNGCYKSEITFCESAVGQRARQLLQGDLEIPFHAIRRSSEIPAHQIVKIVQETFVRAGSGVKLPVYPEGLNPA